MNLSQEDEVVSVEQAFVRALRIGAGFTEEFARHLVELMMHPLRKDHGGQQLYIPREDRRARDESIARAFNGRNADELCRKHGISRARLYEIVKEQK